jgi:hypothetical protein
MPMRVKLRGTICLEYDADDLMDAARWTQQLENIAQRLRSEGYPNVSVEVRERRDRAKREGVTHGSDTPSFRKAAPA